MRTGFAQLFALPILNGRYCALPKLPVLMTAFLAIDPYVSSLTLSIVMISKLPRPCLQVFLFILIFKISFRRAQAYYLQSLSFFPYHCLLYSKSFAQLSSRENCIQLDRFQCLSLIKPLT